MSDAAVDCLLGLDFDGVLNDGDAEAENHVLDSTLVRRLDMFLRKVSGSVGVVVISAWRFDYSFEELRDVLVAGGLVSAPVVGVVGGRQNKRTGWDFRCDRFKTYVEGVGCKRYAILDDGDWHYGLRKQPNGLLYTPGFVGVPRFLKGRIVCPDGKGMSVKDGMELVKAFDGLAKTCVEY